MANFNYCPAVWHFCSAKDKHKVEKIQERTLRFVYSDYCSSYSELLDKAETCTLELRRIHFICTETYKTITNIRPEYMNSLVIPNQSHYSSRRHLNLLVSRINQTTYVWSQEFSLQRYSTLEQSTRRNKNSLKFEFF